MPFANREKRNRWRRAWRERRRAEAHRAVVLGSATLSPREFDSRAVSVPSVSARETVPEVPAQLQVFQPFGVECSACFDTGRTSSGSPCWCAVGQRLLPTAKKRTDTPKPVATDSLPGSFDLLKAASWCVASLVAVVVVWLGKKLFSNASEAVREIVTKPSYESWTPEIAAAIRNALPGD